jgi:CMP/dCMP kinase
LKKINIAIDGFSSCGKGTLAKSLSKALSYLFIDTGAMYRAVTFAILENQIDIDDTSRITKLLPSLNIEFQNDPAKNKYRTILNGIDIENEIRDMHVSQFVSPVSKIDDVRAFLVKAQQKIGENKGVVMDGRDIGTVVFPQAELKLFMTAKVEIRAQRRLDELRSKGDSLTTYDEVLENLSNRDAMDSGRSNSPLVAAKDAIVIDNSYISRDEQFIIAYNQALKIIES